MIADPTEVVELLANRHSTSRWSPSLRWLQSAVELSIDLIVNGYVLPELETDGLNWKASWKFITDPVVSDQIEKLERLRPPVVISSQETTTKIIVQYLVDAACRTALKHSGWKPTFPRSRKSSVTAFRRLMAGLYDPNGQIEADTEQHDLTFLKLSSDLGHTRARLEGTPDIKSRGRLVPRNDEDLWELEFEIYSIEDPSLVVPWIECWEETPLARQIVDGAPLEPIQKYILQTSRRLANIVPGLDTLETEASKGKLLLSISEVSVLLLDGLNLCEVAGVPILVPKGLLRQQFKLRAEASPSERGGISANLGVAMVDVDWNIIFGDDQLNEEDLQILAEAKSGLVQLKGQWVNIDANQAQMALELLTQRKKQSNLLSPAELLRFSSDEAQGVTQNETQQETLITETTASEEWIVQLLEGLPDETLQEAFEPELFSGSLRPYQRRGLAWLQFLSKLGLGGCLADDMGLGKTPTTLAHILSRNASQPTLVICPLSVVHNWESEAKKFTPDLKVFVAHGSGRPTGQSLIESAQESDIVVTTYATATRDIGHLTQINWDLLICDEAQFIKNHHTNAAMAVRKIQASQKIALTGTPVENRLSELWAILDAVNPGMLGGISWFRENFATPIETYKDSQALEQMRRLTDPFILRRTKDDKSLVPDLPEKIEQVAWAKLTQEQAALYKAVLDDFLSEASKIKGMKRKGLILATLTKLKQICNHPAQFLADGSSVAGRSGKLARLEELIVDVLRAEQQLLIFTQYRAMGDLLAEHLAGILGIQPPFLHGGVPRAKRESMIRSFQNGSDSPILLISLKAGGTGLNLTAANRVVHFDRWWNPAVEDQATDRAWRIGQNQTVFVHKLVCQGTLEEKIDQLLTDKKELANRSVGTGDDWFTDMDTEQLREVLSLNLAEAVDG
ncbi:MAG: DEAD/DEAH box helicase [Actinomycetota bacterium]|nr:DEAD/DEAH box helicase [Actinomycetota bacterium]